MHASFSSMAEYSFCFHFISLPLNNGNILSSFFFSCSVRCQKGIFSRTTHRYCRSNSSHAKMSATHAENETAREREKKRLCTIIIIIVVAIAIVSAKRTAVQHLNNWLSGRESG